MGSGANFGANFTLVGALAGLMFASILREKGVGLSYTAFAWHGARVMVAVTVVSTAVLWLELWTWPV